jgi:hypothetical protein
LKKLQSYNLQVSNHMNIEIENNFAQLCWSLWHYIYIMMFSIVSTFM